MRIVASFITGLSLLSPLAAAAAPYKIGNVVTSPTLCEGVRIDRKMTYHEFLKEYGLDLKSQDTYIRSGQLELLAQMKFTKYVQQSDKVKKAQVHLCGRESANWND